MTTARRLWMISSASLLILLQPSAVFPQTPAGNAPLTLEEVVKLSRARFSEDVIVAKIKKNARPFDLTADELEDLRNAGVSQNVIKFLVDPSQPYAPPAAPPPPVAPTAAASPRPEPPPLPTPAPVVVPKKQYPPDARVSKVPADPGVYHFSGDVPIKLDIKIVLGVKEGPGLAKVLLKKSKTIAYLPGAAAKLRIQEATPEFYIRLIEGKAIEEVALVALDRKSDRREIDLGPKPELKAESVRAVDPVEVGPQLFRVTTAKLMPGEFLFFLIGSGEPAKGSFGKGYDFGVDQRKKQAR